MVNRSDKINTVEKQSIVDAAMAYYDKASAKNQKILFEACKAYEEAQNSYGTFTSERECCMGGPMGRGCNC